MADADIRITVDADHHVNLTVNSAETDLTVNLKLPPQELGNLIAEMLRQEADAAKKRSGRRRPRTDVPSHLVVPANGAGLLPTTTPEHGAFAFEIGDCLVAYELPVRKIGQLMDAFYQWTQRLSGRSGPPRDRPTDH